MSNCGTREPRRRMETRLEWQPRGKLKIQGGRKVRRHHHHQQQHQQQQQKRRQHSKFQYETQLEQLEHLHMDRGNRSRRSISSPRHVETLIVADPTMSAFHKDVAGYLLTIMNMVSALYKDPSIGNAIEIVVVRIIVLQENDTAPELNLTQNAQKNLDRFCRYAALSDLSARSHPHPSLSLLSWQHKQNEIREEDPHHHDVAILITRKNICGNNCM